MRNKVTEKTIHSHSTEELNVDAGTGSTHVLESTATTGLALITKNKGIF